MNIVLVVFVVIAVVVDVVDGGGIVVDAVVV